MQLYPNTGDYVHNQFDFYGIKMNGNSITVLKKSIWIILLLI